MGIGKFLLGLIGAGATGAGSRFLAGKVAQSAFLGGPLGGAVIGAGLFAAAFFLRGRKEDDNASLWEPQKPRSSGDLWERLVLGELKTGGINIDYIIDRENRTLKSVWLIGNDECEGVIGLEINGEEVEFESPVKNGSAVITTAKFQNRLQVWVRFNSDDIAHPDFRTGYNPGNVSYITIVQSQPEEGDFWEKKDIPDVKFHVKGRVLPDGYTNNPVKLAKWWLEEKGITTTIADNADDYCDVDIAVANALDEPRFRMGAIIESNEPLDRVIQVFERCFNGRIILNPDGTATIHAGRVIPSKTTIKKEEAVEEPTLEILAQPGDFHNEVTASVRTTPTWEREEIKKSANQEHTDGTIVVSKNLGSLRGIFSQGQARRHLAYQLRRAQRTATVAIDLPIEKGLALKLWDRVRYESSEVTGLFRVASHPIPDIVGNQCSIVLLEDPDSLYVDDEEKVDIGNRKIVSLPESITSPQNLRADTDAIIQNDGSVLCQTGVQWDNPPPNISLAEVQHIIKEPDNNTPSSANSAWLESYFGDARRYPVIADTPSGKLIDIRARFLTLSRQESSWIQINNFEIGGDLTPPGKVTSFNAFGQLDAILLKWGRPADSDYAYTKIYMSTSENGYAIGDSIPDTDIRYIGRGTDELVVPLEGDYTKKYFWAVTFDNSGNQGPGEGPVSASATQLVTDIEGLNINIQQRFRSAVEIPDVPTGDPPFVGWGVTIPTPLDGESVWVIERSQLRNGLTVLNSSDWRIRLFIPQNLYSGESERRGTGNQIWYCEINNSNSPAPNGFTDPSRYTPEMMFSYLPDQWNMQESVNGLSFVDPHGITWRGVNPGLEKVTIIEGIRRSSSDDIVVDSVSTSNSKCGLITYNNTAWVIERSGSNFKALAYSINTKRRDSSKDIDFNRILGGGIDIGDATRIGNIIWFMDGRNNYLRAFNADTRARVSNRDINIGLYDDGVFSDDTTIWVVQSTGSGPRFQAYNASTRNRDSSKDIDGKRLIDEGLLPNRGGYGVSLLVDNILYIYERVDHYIRVLDITDTSNPIRLASDDIYVGWAARSSRCVGLDYNDNILYTLLDTDSSGRYKYIMAAYKNRETTITKDRNYIELNRNPDNSFLIPPQSGSFAIYESSFIVGNLLWIIDIDAGDTSARAYNILTKERDPSQDFHVGNLNHRGAAVGRDVIWIVEDLGNSQEAQAYNTSNRARNSNRDIRLPSRLDGADTQFNSGVSDGRTVWFIDSNSNKAIAYNASDKSRQESSDIELEAGEWSGATTNGSIIWFLNRATRRILVYDIITKTKDLLSETLIDNDISTLQSISYYVGDSTQDILPRLFLIARVHDTPTAISYTVNTIDPRAGGADESERIANIPVRSNNNSFRWYCFRGIFEERQQVVEAGDFTEWEWKPTPIQGPVNMDGAIGGSKVMFSDFELEYRIPVGRTTDVFFNVNPVNADVTSFAFPNRNIVAAESSVQNIDKTIGRVRLRLKARDAINNHPDGDFVTIRGILAGSIEERLNIKITVVAADQVPITDLQNFDIIGLRSSDTIDKNANYEDKITINPLPDDVSISSSGATLNRLRVDRINDPIFTHAVRFTSGNNAGSADIVLVASKSGYNNARRNIGITVRDNTPARIPISLTDIPSSYNMSNLIEYLERYTVNITNTVVSITSTFNGIVIRKIDDIGTSRIFEVVRTIHGLAGFNNKDITIRATDPNDNTNFSEKTLSLSALQARLELRGLPSSVSIDAQYYSKDIIFLPTNSNAVLTVDDDNDGDYLTTQLSDVVGGIYNGWKRLRITRAGVFADRAFSRWITVRATLNVGGGTQIKSKNIQVTSEAYTGGNTNPPDPDPDNTTDGDGGI